MKTQKEIFEELQDLEFNLKYMNKTLVEVIKLHTSKHRIADIEERIKYTEGRLKSLRWVLE